MKTKHLVFLIAVLSSITAENITTDTIIDNSIDTNFEILLNSTESLYENVTDLSDDTIKNSIETVDIYNNQTSNINVNETHELYLNENSTEIEIITNNFTDLVELKNNTLQSNMSFRLPGNIIPDLYTIEIKTYLEDDFNFEGRVKIQFYCSNDTSEIILHSKDLNISESEVILSDNETGDVIEISEHWYHLDNDFYIIKFLNPILAGQTYLLEIPYRAYLTETLQGYYRSSYLDQKTGATRWLAISKFEPTFARLAFPCFDEPGLKARFHVRLVRRNELSSLSNMPLLYSENADEGWTRDVYAESVLMSTYLVAFIVKSDFVNLESTVGRTNLTIWVRPDVTAHAQYALGIAPKILDFFEQYFETEYSLPKMDMIVVPHLNRGGMEDWGLVTLRENSVLYEDGVAVVSKREDITRLMVHELAHQWFGNLVTVRWWDHIWLHEGFATYLAALGMEVVEPQWQQDHIYKTMYRVMIMDSDPHNLKQVANDVTAHVDIYNMFNSFVYVKGAMLVHMLSTVLGNETFRRGLVRFLHKHQFGSVDEDQLFVCLEEQARLDQQGERNNNAAYHPRDHLLLKQIMDSWTRQPGYPVVHVDRNYENNTATLSQVRYFSEPSISEQVWHVPLVMKDAGGGTRLTWLRDNHTILTNLPDRQHELIVNLGLPAPYFVNYDPTNWALLATALCDPTSRATIPPVNRAHLMDSAMVMVFRGPVDYLVTFDLLKCMDLERTPLVWRSFFNYLPYHLRVNRLSERYQVLRGLIRSILAPSYSDLGKDPFFFDSSESVVMAIHRKEILEWACKMNVGDCRVRAAAIFETWRNKTADHVDYNVPKDIQNTVFCSGVSLAGEEIINFITTLNDSQKENSLVSALGCFEQPELLQKVLNITISPSRVLGAMHHTYNIFSRIVGNEIAFEEARDFYFKRIEEIHDFYTIGTKQVWPFGEYLSLLALRMSTQQELDELRSFVASNHSDVFSQVESNMKIAEEIIEENIAWQVKNLQNVTNWLAAWEVNQNKIKSL